MPSTLSSLERVLMALSHEAPARVPLALWGSTYGLIDSLYRRLRSHLGLSRDGEILMRPRKGHTVNFMDDRLLDALGTDVRYVWSKATDLNSPLNGSGPDLFGVEFQKTGFQVHPIHFPLAQADMNVVTSYKMPDAVALVDRSFARQRAKDLREKTECAVVARAPNSFGL